MEMRLGCGEMRKGFAYHAESPGFETLDQIINMCTVVRFLYNENPHVCSQTNHLDGYLPCNGRVLRT